MNIELFQAFEELKTIIEEPVLLLLDHTKPFEVHTNASEFAIMKYL